MIRAIVNYITKPPPIPTAYLDGALYALAAWFTFSQFYLGGDDAAKYIDPLLKFWILYGIGSGAAVVLAVKGFRSTAFANYKSEKADQSEIPPVEPKEKQTQP